MSKRNTEVVQSDLAEPDTHFVDIGPESEKSVESVSGQVEDFNLREDVDLKYMVEQNAPFLRLPSELLLHICSFLEASDILKSLACVCKQFYTELTSFSWWKARVAKKWPNKVFPAIKSTDDSENWPLLCMNRERGERLWKNRDSQIQQFTLSYGIFSAVDCVNMLKDANLLVSGSRDKYISAWDLSLVDVETPQSLIDCKVISKDKAHEGWIWCLDSHDTQLASGSWDRYIKLWDIENNLQQTQDFKLKAAVLCLSLQERSVLSGSFDGCVVCVDRRVGVTSSRKPHSKPVLCLAERGHVVLTGSEDGTLVFHDCRAAKDFSVIKLSSYPKCISWQNNTLWAGGNNGSLSLISTTGTPALVAEYPIHTKQILKMVQNEGYLVTSSRDKTIFVLEPSQDPGILCSLTSEKPEEGSALDLQNDVLAAGFESSISVWRPKL